MRLKALFLVAVAALVLSGCAHNISISPDLAKVQRPAGMQPLDKSVGFYIPAEKRELAVTTPGGGGDKVTYKPYKDIETGFYQVLSNTFARVTLLSSPNDQEAISKNGINYVIVPTLTTNSSSSSVLTWPPTQFTVDITSTITDTSGKVLATPLANGQGNAEFSEFKRDFGLAGKRASEDALIKLQGLLLETPALRN